LTLSSEALAGCSRQVTPWIKVNNRKHVGANTDRARKAPEELFRFCRLNRRRATRKVPHGAESSEIEKLS
jgi:hypothetical protein